ncbi:phage tail protein, partial [Streptomyces scabiei]
MAEQYLHGAEVVEIDNGARPIRTAQSGVIGLVGTAPDADATAFPLNTPVLIAGSRREAVKLGAGGTLPQAIDGIFDQIGAVVVVIRVDEGVDSAATQSNVIGKVDADTEQ